MIAFGGPARGVAGFRAAHQEARWAQSTAAALGVHERTISNRLRAVEEVLGQRPQERHAELDLALRLHGLLGQTVSP